jgi:hypothetical protein
MESRPGRRRDGCLRTTHFLREKRRFQQAFQVDLPLLRLATSSEAAIHQQHIARQFSSSEEKRQGIAWSSRSADRCSGLQPLRRR